MTLLNDQMLDYVFGTLPEDLRVSVDKARALDTELDASVSELELGLVPMFVSGQPVAPPADLWAAIEAGIDGNDLSPENLRIDLFPSGIWATTGIGVRTKLIWDGRSMLIECEPGASIPQHEHWAEERILVISGDVCFADRCYGPGDTIAMHKGSFHGETTTRTGCLFLLSYVS
jgi:anti-sigma factor ChrR (cupin superfamily)